MADKAIPHFPVEATPSIAMVLRDRDLLRFGEVECSVRLNTADVVDGRFSR